MPERPTDPLYPDPPPKSRSFGDLLQWHVEFGTFPGCRPTRVNDPWDAGDISKRVCYDADKDAATRTFRGWRNGRAPRLAHEHRIRELFMLLFGDAEELAPWRRDLERALALAREDSAARQANWKRSKSQKPPVAGDNAIAFTSDEQETDSDGSRPVQRGQIPRVTPHFIGREDDEKVLLSALLAPDSRAAILVQGAAGIGKTELTKAVALRPETIARFGANRWFVPLDAAPSPGLMRDAIIRALNGDLTHGLSAALARLGGSPALIILDNLETPWDGPEGQRVATEDLLAEIIRTDGVALIASFRGMEYISARWTKVHFVQSLSEADAQSLFAEIGACTDERDQIWLLEFVRVLGGVPLAIDLVARRAFGRSVRSLWNEWLTIGTKLAARGIADSALTSLDRTIELSLCSPRINEGALRLFRYLGQLPAGLCREDRNALLGLHGLNAEEILCGTGLAIQRNDRIDLLPPIREYAASQYSPDRQEMGEIRARLLSIAEEVGRTVSTKEDSGIFSRFLTEFPNIENISLKAIASRDHSEVITRLDSIIKLTNFGLISSSLYEELAKACLADNDETGAAKCIMATGSSREHSGKYDEASVLYERALGIFCKLGDERGEADCLAAIGHIELARSNLEKAMWCQSRLLEISQKAGDIGRQAYAHFILGDVFLRRMDTGQAEQHFAAALRLYVQCDRQLGEANCTFRLGDIELERGNLTGAAECYRAANATYKRLNNLPNQANCIKGMADISKKNGDLSGAATQYQEALAMFRSVGDRYGESNCLLLLGIIWIESDRIHDALSSISAASVQYESLGAMYDYACCLNRIGDIKARMFERAAAVSYYEKAVALFNDAIALDEAKSCGEKIDALNLIVEDH